MIKLTNVSKTYSRELFSKVGFSIGNGEKIGLVGLNGCGKTTLLKILAGEEATDSGSVEIVSEKIGYLPQEFKLPNDMLVGEYLESLVENIYIERYKIDKTLSKLGLIDLDEYRVINSLSGGEKMKLFLADLLIKDSSVLLLDEPTNHLDILGILWLEEFVKKFKGICLIISHDRMFLNSVVNHIYEIDEGKLTIFQGNYDDYIGSKEDMIGLRHKQFVVQEKHRERLLKLLENARKVSDGKKRGRAVESAKKRMEREITAKEISRYEEEKISDFEVKGFVHSGKKIVEAKNISFYYDKNKTILNELNLSLFGRERIWIYGSNGIGKTTLIKIIMGELKQKSGEILWGENIAWEYFSQDQSHIDMNSSVEDYFLATANVDYNKSFGLLEKFLFPKEFRKYKLANLSPGQRARLSFACFSCHENELLILDEPTNHLDIKTKEVIEESLVNYKGAMILISHDRYFVESVGITKSYTIFDGKLVEI